MYEFALKNLKSGEVKKYRSNRRDGFVIPHLHGAALGLKNFDIPMTAAGQFIINVDPIHDKMISLAGVEYHILKRKLEAHGGKRENSGREALHGKTMVMRVPVALADAVRKLIADFKP